MRFPGWSFVSHMCRRMFPCMSSELPVFFPAVFPDFPQFVYKPSKQQTVKDDGRLQHLPRAIQTGRARRSISELPSTGC